MRGPVLVLGSGELGAEVIKALLDSRSFSSTPISVLQRSTSLPPSLRDRTTHRSISVLECDLSISSVEDLSHIFEPFQTIVCCTGFVGGTGTQIKITKAVLQAKGPRKLYIPWQFGIDYDTIGRGSGQIVWDEQLDVRDLLRSQSTADWLIVSTGMFTSFLFEPSFGVVNTDSLTCRALGGWDNKVTVTCVEDIGRCVAAILAEEEEEVAKNRVVFIGGDTVTYSQVANVVAQRLEARGKIERVDWTLQHLKEELDKDPSNIIKMYRYAFAKGTGMSWPLETCWNVSKRLPMLNLPQWCEKYEIP